MTRMVLGGLDTKVPNTKCECTFRVGHCAFAEQTQELLGSKKEIGILLSLLLGFPCLYCF
jgi:hypothetical protein